MLKEFITSITGAATNAAYTNPGANGIRGISPGASFKNFFNTIFSSFSNSPGAVFGNSPQAFGNSPQAFGNFPQGSGGTSYGAVNAYRNAQTQFGGFPGQIIDNPQANGRKLKAQILAPGSVVINSVGTNAPVQSPIAQGFGFAGLTPLQGGTGQTIPFINGGPQAGFGQTPFGQPVPFAPNGFPQQGGFSKWSLLLMPIIGLFSMVKSLFGLRNIVNSIKPVSVDKEDINFYGYQNGFNEIERQEGSFDELYPEEIETDSFDVGKLQEGF
jgi:hypothetical protein